MSKKLKSSIGEDEILVFRTFMQQTLGKVPQGFIFVESNEFGRFRYINLGGAIYEVNGCEYIGVAFDYFENKMYFLDEDFDIVATLEYTRL